MLLYRNLGIMELDDCGMWIDRPIEDAEWLSEAECPMPPGVPSDWMDDAGVEPSQVDGALEEAPQVLRQPYNAVRGRFAELLPTGEPVQQAGDSPIEMGAMRGPARETQVSSSQMGAGVPLLTLIEPADERAKASTQARVQPGISKSAAPRLPELHLPEDADPSFAEPASAELRPAADQRPLKLRR
jgi:hypothetical protein